MVFCVVAVLSPHHPQRVKQAHEKRSLMCVGKKGSSRPEPLWRHGIPCRRSTSGSNATGRKGNTAILVNLAWQYGTAKQHSEYKHSCTASNFVSQHAQQDMLHRAVLLCCQVLLFGQLQDASLALPREALPKHSPSTESASHNLSENRYRGCFLQANEAHVRLTLGPYQASLTALAQCMLTHHAHDRLASLGRVIARIKQLYISLDAC